jgi:hypothetical protein
MEIAVQFSSGFRPPSIALVIVRQILVIVCGTAVAALIPPARWRQSFVYGLVLPFAVALVIVLSQGPGPQPVHPAG